MGWRVVGWGADAGGVTVHTHNEFTALESDLRILPGSLVEQKSLARGILKYRLLSGVGPETGWFGVKARINNEEKVQVIKVAPGELVEEPGEAEIRRQARTAKLRIKEQ